MQIFPWGCIEFPGPLTIMITDQRIVAKWCGLIKIRDIPLANIISFEYISKKRIHLTFFYLLSDSIRITYNKDDKVIEEYIIGTRKSLEQFLKELQDFKNREKCNPNKGILVPR
jgi:hypothetical protein